MKDVLQLSETVRPTPQNVCAIIVAYYPDDTFPLRAHRIARQVGNTLIVDNGGGEATPAMLAELTGTDGIHLLVNERNMGVAAAQNQGVEWALRRGFAWVVLFDQDTMLHEDMMQRLSDIYDEYPHKDRLAVLGANYYSPRNKRRTPRFVFPERSATSWAAQPAVISSGSLISTGAWTELGGFRADYFIDDVDNEYCLRAQCRGFTVIVSREPLMEHDLGAVTYHRLPLHATGTSNHAPFRRYYMTRNRIATAKAYLLRKPSYVFKLLCSYAKNIVLMLLFEKDRPKKLAFVLLGVWHGILGRMHRL